MGDRTRAKKKTAARSARAARRKPTIVGGFAKPPSEDPLESLDAGWSEIRKDLPPASRVVGKLPTLPDVPGQPFPPSRDEDLEAASAPQDAGIERRAETYDRSALESRMNDRFGTGDLEGALETAEEILRHAPDHADAQRVRTRARERLTETYAARLGSLARVPHVLLSPKELIELGLDARSGFVLSQIDWASRLEEILDVTGMPRFESYRILCDLLFAEIIALR